MAFENKPHGLKYEKRGIKSAKRRTAALQDQASNFFMPKSTKHTPAKGDYTKGAEAGKSLGKTGY